MLQSCNRFVYYSSISTASIIEELEKETGSSYFNISLLCYGRHCIDAVSDKVNACSLAKERDPLVFDFFNRVLEDDSWEYESWLLHDAQNELKNNITVLNDTHISLQIDTFTQSLKQSIDAQHQERTYIKNILRKTKYITKISVLVELCYNFL